MEFVKTIRTEGVYRSGNYLISLFNEYTHYIDMDTLEVVFSYREYSFKDPRYIRVYHVNDMVYTFDKKNNILFRYGLKTKKWERIHLKRKIGCICRITRDDMIFVPKEELHNYSGMFHSIRRTYTHIYDLRTHRCYKVKKNYESFIIQYITDKEYIVTKPEQDTNDCVIYNQRIGIVRRIPCPCSDIRYYTIQKDYIFCNTYEKISYYHIFNHITNQWEKYESQYILQDICNGTVFMFDQKKERMLIYIREVLQKVLPLSKFDRVYAFPKYVVFVCRKNKMCIYRKHRKYEKLLNSMPLCKDILGIISQYYNTTRMDMW